MFSLKALLLAVVLGLLLQAAHAAPSDTAVQSVNDAYAQLPKCVGDCFGKGIPKKDGFKSATEASAACASVTPDQGATVTACVSARANCLAQSQTVISGIVVSCNSLLGTGSAASASPTDPSATGSSNQTPADPTSTATANSDSGSGKGSNTAAVAASVTIVLLVVIAGGVLGFLYYRRRTSGPPAAGDAEKKGMFDFITKGTEKSSKLGDKSDFLPAGAPPPGPTPTDIPPSYSDPDQIGLAKPAKPETSALFGSTGTSASTLPVSEPDVDRKESSLFPPSSAPADEKRASGLFSGATAGPSSAVDEKRASGMVLDAGAGSLQKGEPVPPQEGASSSSVVSEKSGFPADTKSKQKDFETSSITKQRDFDGPSPAAAVASGSGADRSLPPVPATAQPAPIRPETVDLWTSTDVSTWLHSIGMKDEIVANLKVRNVNGQDLLAMTDERLIELGIDQAGIRETILYNVTRLSSGDGVPIANASDRLDKTRASPSSCSQRKGFAPGSYPVIIYHIPHVHCSQRMTVIARGIALLALLATATAIPQISFAGSEATPIPDNYYESGNQAYARLGSCTTTCVGRSFNATNVKRPPFNTNKEWADFCTAYINSPGYQASVQCIGFNCGTLQIQQFANSITQCAYFIGGYFPVGGPISLFEFTDTGFAFPTSFGLQSPTPSDSPAPEPSASSSPRVTSPSSATAGPAAPAPQQTPGASGNNNNSIPVTTVVAIAVPVTCVAIAAIAIVAAILVRKNRREREEAEEERKRATATASTGAGGLPGAGLSPPVTGAPQVFVGPDGKPVAMVPLDPAHAPYLNAPLPAVLTTSTVAPGSTPSWSTSPNTEKSSALFNNLSPSVPSVPSLGLPSSTYSGGLSTSSSSSTGYAPAVPAKQPATLFTGTSATPTPAQIPAEAEKVVHYSAPAKLSAALPGSWTPVQVQAWLQTLGLRDDIVAALRGMDGAELMALTDEGLRARGVEPAPARGSVLTNVAALRGVTGTGEEVPPPYVSG
ncbi:hypothetical protein HDU96_003623 [Phlyctochytrium bullatum]|nr:hypothetical protein HDU96_003623 [Phlyctochytrium bullatum]